MPNKLWLATLLFLAACSGDDTGSSDAVSGGPTCETLCDAMERCSDRDGSGSSGASCVQSCTEQRGLFNQRAWTAYTACVSEDSCESPSACADQAITLSSSAPADQFVSELCDRLSTCTSGLYAKNDCLQTVETLGGPFDYLRLLRGSVVSCMSGCVRAQSCSQTSYAAVSSSCASQCGLTELAALSEDQEARELCQEEHGSCGEHGRMVASGRGNCACQCDAQYVASDWVCVADCQQTGCGEHGSCENNGVCSCDAGYEPSPGAAEDCKKLPRFMSVSAGEDSSCGLRDDGAVECWGAASDAVQTLPEPNTGFVQLALGASAIDSAACALREDGHAVCWGRIEPAATKLKQISLNADTACGIDTEQQLRCWGFSPYGATNPTLTGKALAVALGDRIACAIREDHSLGCWGDASVIGAVPALDQHVEQVCARAGGACVRLADGSVRCFGLSSYASETIPEPNSGFTDVSCGESAACALRADGKAVCWGSPLLAPDEHYSDVDVGRDYACGVREDGSVGCWGHNARGQAPASYSANPRGPVSR